MLDIHNIMFEINNIVAALIGIETFYPARLRVPQVLSIMGAAVLIIPFALLQYFERKGVSE